MNLQDKLIKDTKNLKSTVLLSIFIFSLLVSSLLFNIAPAKFPSDDSFFYLQIAYNIATGNGSTFNNIVSTNGYHPLWMFFCILSVYVSLLNKTILMHSIWLLQMIMFILSIYIFKNINRDDNDAWILGAIFLSIIFVSLGTMYFLESHLALLLLLSIIYVMNDNAKIQHKRWIILGILFAGLFLSRLDTIFIIASLLITSIFFNLENSYKNRLLMTVIFGTLSSPYLMFNYYYYGHFVPISGKIKTSFVFSKISINNLGIYGELLLFAILIYIIILIFSKNQESDNKRKILIGLNAGCLVHFSYCVLFQEAAMWYWVGAYVSLSFFTTYIFSKIKKKYIIDTCIIIGCLLMIITTTLKVFTNFSITHVLIERNEPIQYQKTDLIVRFVEDLEKIIPKDSAIFVHDGPGRLAYFSNLKIFPCDGLVGDYQYPAFIEKNGILEYLRKFKIKYILAPYDVKVNNYKHTMMIIERGLNQNNLTVLSPTSRHECGTIELLDSDIIKIFESPWKKFHPLYSKVALWPIK